MQTKGETDRYTDFTLTMTSHEHNVVLNHQQFECLFNSLWGPTSKKHQCPHYWPFVKEIHWWPVDSPHERPVTREKRPFDDVIMHPNKITGHRCGAEKWNKQLLYMKATSNHLPRLKWLLTIKLFHEWVNSCFRDIRSTFIHETNGLAISYFIPRAAFVDSGSRHSFHDDWWSYMQGRLFPRL